MTGPERPASPSPAAPDDDAQPTSYLAAMAELDAILRSLEDDDLDVDALAANVGRAADLLRWCRFRITDTKMQVEIVVADLEREDLPPV